MKPIYWILLFFINSSFTVWAQETTLSNLYKNAASYASLEAKSTAIKSAELNYKIVKKGNLPTLEVQAQNTYGTYKGLAGAVFPLPGNYNISGVESSGTAVNTLVSATAKWDIIRFGKHKDRVKVADIQKKESQIFYDLEDLDLKKQITHFYIEWMYAKKMKEWAENEISRHQGLLNIARAKTNSGQSSAADSLLVKSQYSQAKADAKKWASQAEKAANKIEKFTGVAITAFQVPDSFTTTALQLPVSDSLENHPLLEVKDHRKEQLAVEKKNINHEVLPDISLLASGMSRGAGYSDENQWGDSYKLPVNNYLIGLGLSWKLDGFYSKGLKKQKNLQEQVQVEQEKEVIEGSLYEEEESLTHQLVQTDEEIKESQKSYEAIKQSYDLFKTRYESGIIDLTTLYQIEQNLQFSEHQLIKSYYQYWLHWKDYAYIKNDYSTLIETFN